MYGLVAEGLKQHTLASKFETFPKSHHVDDAGSNPICLEVSTGYAMTIMYIYIRFPVIVVWLNGRGVQLTHIGLKILDLSKIPPCG